ncbi:hypothetical protein PFMALIP_05694, partial [Plasmodium falciparum MaliPS096_E11]
NEIKSKIDTFCGGSNEEKKKLKEQWKCYEAQYVKEDKEEDEEDEDEVKEEDYLKNAGGLCILQNKKHESETNSQNEPEQFQKTYNDFFYFWIRRFLNDSMYWRGKHEKCLKNDKKTCGNEQCKGNCECFLKWITQKKTEWDAIKKHFKTQDDIDKVRGFIEFSKDRVLEDVLELKELFNNIKDGYGDVKELEGIKNMLEKENEINQAESADGNDSQKKTTIDKLLKHEEDEANKCKNCTPPQKPTKPAGDGGDVRSADSPPAAKKEESEEEEEEEEEEEDEDEVQEEEDEPGEDINEDSTGDTDVKGSEPPKEASPTPAPTVEKVCKIVGDALNNMENLKEACKQKYDGKYYGWKCVTPSGDGKTTTTGGESEAKRKRRSADSTTRDGEKATPPSNSGATCIPPRRRRLYIHKVDDNVKDDAYKKLNTKNKGETQGVSSLLTLPDADLGDASQEEEPPDKQLQRGHIPTDFLRLMFYTLGDYRDILFSGSKDEKSGDTDIFSGDKEIAQREEKIKGAIQKFFENGDSQTPSVKQPSGENP